MNPIEVRHGALSPVNTVTPLLAVANAFGADGFSTPTLLGIFDSAPYFRHGEAQTLEEAFGIGTDPNFLSAARAHWRSGTGGAPNVLDKNPTAVRDLIAFLRTIDDRTERSRPLTSRQTTRRSRTRQRSATARRIRRSERLRSTAARDRARVTRAARRLRAARFRGNLQP